MVRHEVLGFYIIAIALTGRVQAQPQFVKVDYPGQSASLTAINNSGQIVGANQPDLGVNQFGFLTDTSGRIGPAFRYPGARLFTFASGIDNAGNILGTSDAASSPFLRSSNGTFTLLSLPPGLSFVSRAAISGNGAIAFSSKQNLFLPTTSGNYTSVPVPGAGTVDNAVNVTGMDNGGNVVGFYYPTSGAATSFYRDVRGNFQPILVSGSQYTEVGGMNNLGQAVGFYYDGTLFHGFLWRGGTDFTNLDYPGAIRTFASGINDSGIIVGFYDDNLGRHGMIYFSAGVPNPSTVPAPSTGLLGLTGILGLLGHQLWRRRAAK